MREMKLDRKTRYTRMALQDSLIELMKQKPISKITIKELCENADINRTTFYTHYTDQYDLLRNIENEALEWVKDAVSNLLNTDRNEMLKIIEDIMQYFVDNHKHLQVLISEQGDISFPKQLFTMVYGLCGITPSATKSGDSPGRELQFVFMVNGSVGLIQHWLKNGLDKTSHKDIARTIYDMASRIR